MYLYFLAHLYFSNQQNRQNSVRVLSYANATLAKKSSYSCQPGKLRQNNWAALLRQTSPTVGFVVIWVTSQSGGKIIYTEKKPKSLALNHLGSFLGFSRLVIIVTSSVKKKSFERCPPRRISNTNLQVAMASPSETPVSYSSLVFFVHFPSFFWWKGNFFGGLFYIYLHLILSLSAFRRWTSIWKYRY